MSLRTDIEDASNEARLVLLKQITQAAADTAKLNASAQASALKDLAEAYEAITPLTLQD